MTTARTAPSCQPGDPGPAGEGSRDGTTGSAIMDPAYAW
jgi:hypothetical protein